MAYQWSWQSRVAGRTHMSSLESSRELYPLYAAMLFRKKLLLSSTKQVKGIYKERNRLFSARSAEYPTANYVVAYAYAYAYAYGLWLCVSLSRARAVSGERALQTVVDG